MGRKTLLAAAAALGVLAFPLAGAGPASAAAPGPAYRVGCVNGYYYWCDEVASTGILAELDIHNGSDTNGHDWAYTNLRTTHRGQNLWVLTSNGSGGWDWYGVPADYDLGGGWYGAYYNKSDAGVLIKVAVYNYDTGSYMYTNAH
ncbi:hypothetical protein J5Y04_06550 [Kitasatospora sp. RG8]|uniref:hypothetical protein n=1 Tax=Kitasatospora sp. RG8 TaxID=2820815 RepID=UPI001ADFBB17|nr:hypothetical protein [Kitasatospora sp. RG8]MBP0449207.1 hypothetical protein [Kitasatospora sp. RG8]